MKNWILIFLFLVMFLREKLELLAKASNTQIDVIENVRVYHLRESNHKGFQTIEEWEDWLTLMEEYGLSIFMKVLKHEH